MARMSAIDEGGGRPLVLRLVGEGKPYSFIRDKLAEDGVCDLTTQAIAHYIGNLESDPLMRDAMKIAAKRQREAAADLVTSTSQEQLMAFQRLVRKLIPKVEAVLDEFDGNLAEAMPRRDDESDAIYKARLEAVDSLVKNLPKLDARVEAWSKIMGSLEGTGTFSQGASMVPQPSSLTVNINHVTIQYQRIMIDAISWMPEDKRALFMDRLKAIELQEPVPV